MRNAISARRFAHDVEITLSGDQAMESHFEVSKPGVRVPNEVFRAGPNAVAEFTKFMARVGSISPLVEHVELSSVA